MGLFTVLGNCILLFCIFAPWIIPSCYACILTCQCTPKKQKGRNVDCRKLADPISSLTNLKFPPDTVHLDLSSNALVVLGQGSFIQLSSLQRLNLSGNKISIIESGAFDGLQSLKRLDLSHNQLDSINSRMFNGLPSLTKLTLSFNRITVIPDGTFNDLTKLKRFEFQSTYLWCDCRLKWMLLWAKHRNVKISSSTLCAGPSRMKGRRLARMKTKELKCRAQKPIHLVIRPSESQLVFMGDKLPFECRASVSPGQSDLTIGWFRSGHLVRTDKSKGLFVRRDYNQDRTVINHRLVVESLDTSHTGEWTCVLSTPKGNLTKSVHVQVRTLKTSKCSATTNKTSRGVYSWDETVAGLQVTQPCRTAVGIDEDAVAIHTCGMNGVWTTLDVSECGYLNAVTQKLAEFASTASASQDLPMLIYFLQNAFKNDRDQMGALEVSYLASILVDTILPSTLDSRENAGYLLDLVGNVTILPDKVLRSSQVEYAAASRITQAVTSMLHRTDTSRFPASEEWVHRSKSLVAALKNRDQVLQQGLSCTLKNPKRSSSNQKAGNDKHDKRASLVDVTDSDSLLDLPSMDFSCDDHSDTDEGTGLVSVFIPPSQSSEIHPVGTKDVNPSVTTTTTRSTITTTTTERYTSSAASILPSDPHHPTSVSTTPSYFSLLDKLDNETDDSTNNTHKSFGINSPQNLVSGPTHFHPNHFKDTESNSNPFRRFSRSASRTKQPQNNPNNPLLPPKGFPNFPLSADQLKEFNITSKYIFNISSLSGSKQPIKFDKNVFPFFQLSNSPSANPPNPKRTSSLNSRSNNVFVVIYQKGNLFPILKSNEGDPVFQSGTWEVVTPVVVISLGDEKRVNLTTPLAITFEVSGPRKPLKAAYYNYQAINGYGAWFVDGCDIIYKNGSTVTVQVRHLSAFAILEEISYVFRLADFPMEPVIYAGSGLCAVCMLILINTYICCFGSIGVPKKIKHSVINLCLSSFLMLTVFAVGINRTSMAMPCQMVGIGLHYLTLCALFWITITVNITYKKFVKATRPPEPPPELVPMPLPPKPILQFYFVGYGVPTIICGITAAVNLDFYAGIKYCFLEWEPSLGAFYAPVALLVAWNLVLFMRISCVVRTLAESEAEAANESEDNEVHNNEIELVPSQPDTTTTTTHNINGHNRHSNHISNSFSHHRYSRAVHDTSSEEDAASIVSLPDQERRPITQLRALVAIHFLFIVMWTCGALAIAKPFQLIIPYQELIFSYLYGLMATLFGMFMLVYFLFTRTDSRLSWKRKFGCAPPETYSAPLEVTDTQIESPVITPQPTPQITNLPIANGSAVKSNSNTNLSVYSQKSSNITKAYNMKNNTNKQSNINLILANSSDLSYGSTQDNYPNFYNPRQNGAAKKFWQKNRQHSKVINKDINRDLNSSLTDNNSSNEQNHPRLSNGTSSEANTHLSIEIQIQPKPQPGGANTNTNPNTKKGSVSGSREIPVHISNSHNNMASSCGAISLEHNNHSLLMHDIDSNMDIVSGGDEGGNDQIAGLEHNDLSSPSSSKDKTVNVLPLSTTNNCSDSNASNSNLPQQCHPEHQRSPSSGSALSAAVSGAGGGSGNVHHPSAFTPVQPRMSGIIENPGTGSEEGLLITSSPSHRQEVDGVKEKSPPRNQLSGPVDPTGVTQCSLQPLAGDVTLQQRPPNPGVAWNPFPCGLPPMPTSHHPNNNNNNNNNTKTNNINSSYSLTPPPQYHQVMKQQHYAFDFGQYPSPNQQYHHPPPMSPINNNTTNSSQSPHPAMSQPNPIGISMSPISIMSSPPPIPNSYPPPVSLSSSQPHPAANFNIPPSPYLIQTQQSYSSNNRSLHSPVSSSSQSQSHQHHNPHRYNQHRNNRHRRNHSNHSGRVMSGGDSSDNSSRSRPHRQHRSSGGSPRRANMPENAPSRSPVTVASDSHVSFHPAITNSSLNDLATTNPPKKAKSVDGDHYSDPTHRKKHKHRQNNKLTNKQRSLGWDEQLKHRTPKINYVYVNHMYRDKVMHKLIKQASESDDLASKAFWLPRSASEYERLTQRGFCSMADDSSSSSDEDSLDNIWIPQRSFTDFQKKETSV